MATCKLTRTLTPALLNYATLGCVLTFSRTGLSDFVEVRAFRARALQRPAYDGARADLFSLGAVSGGVDLGYDFFGPVWYPAYEIFLQVDSFAAALAAVLSACQHCAVRRTGCRPRRPSKRPPAPVEWAAELVPERRSTVAALRSHISSPCGAARDSAAESDLRRGTRATPSRRSDGRGAPGGRSARRCGAGGGQGAGAGRARPAPTGRPAAQGDAAAGRGCLGVRTATPSPSPAVAPPSFLGFSWFLNLGFVNARAPPRPLRGAGRRRGARPKERGRRGRRRQLSGPRGPAAA